MKTMALFFIALVSCITFTSCGGSKGQCGGCNSVASKPSDSCGCNGNNQALNCSCDSTCGCVSSKSPIATSP